MSETAPKDCTKADLIKYKNVKVGDLLKSVSFQGGYATVLDKRMEWELTPTSNDHIEWGLIRVVDSYGEVYWFELNEYDVYKTYHPTTGAPVNTQYEEGKK